MSLAHFPTLYTVDAKRDPDAVDNSHCQAALHATQLAIGRWRLGQHPTEMQVAAALRASAQERWYAHALTQLDAWRASGGFGQDAQQHERVQQEVAKRERVQKAFAQ